MIIVQDKEINYSSMIIKQKAFTLTDDANQEEEEMTCLNKSLTDYTKLKDKECNGSNHTMIFTDINHSRMDTESNLRGFIDQNSFMATKEFDHNELQCNNETQFSIILTKRKLRRSMKNSICHFVLIALIIDIIIALGLFERYLDQFKFKTTSSIGQIDFQFRYKYIYHNYNELFIDNN